MSPRESLAVLGLATSLSRSAREGDAARQTLHGKNIGLLFDAEDEDVCAFREAAVALDARVTLLRFGVWDFSAETDTRRVSHVLGKLYDAIAFQEAASALLVRIVLAAGVPVFAYGRITRDDHPVSCLAGQLPGDEAMADKRRLVLQAMLLNAMR